MFKLFISFFFLFIFSTLPFPITAALDETYLLPETTLEPYQAVIFRINTQDLNVRLNFATDYDMTIEETTSEEIISYTYPYTSVTSSLRDFQFRLFNFGNETKTFNITLNCLRPTQSCSFADQIDKVLSTQQQLPSRAILGTTNVFAMVLTSDVFSTHSLPTNLYSQSQEVFLDFLVSSFPNGFSYTDTTSEDSFDSSYWNDVDVITIPWLPFFTHCTEQDKRPLLFSMLENSPQSCQYRTLDQVKTVGNIPTSGFSSITDSCNLRYECFHVETNRGKSFGTAWYAVKNPTPLFYIYRNPITVDEMIARRSDKTDSFFQNLLNQNSDAMIPVNFRPAENAPQTGLPQHVSLVISFYQATAAEKNIITAEVILSDYTGTTTDTEVSYTFEISFQSLDYFGMINSFRVSIIVYFIAFFFISVAVVAGSWGIWKLNKIIFARKRKMHPTIKHYATFRITFFPQLVGSLLASVGIFIFTIIAIYVKGFISLQGFTPNFNLGSIGSADLIGAERGRIGLGCLFFSIFILNKGISLLVPVPTKEETKVIVKNMTKKPGETTRRKGSNERRRAEMPSVLNASSDSLLEGRHADHVDSDSSEDENKEKTKITGTAMISGLKRKQNHVMLISILAALVLLFVIESSGTSNSGGNTTTTSTILMIGLLVADVASFLVLKHFLLKEILLLAPITTAFEIVQFVLVMRADTFVLFIQSYLLRTLLIMVFRIYLDPILKNLEVHIQTAWRWLMRKRNPALYMRQNLKDMEKVKWRNIELILKKPIDYKENLSTEFIIFTLVNFTTKQCARFMFPIYLLFTYVFPNEHDISELLGLNQRQLIYYIVFWIFMLIPCFVMDIYILNILEIVHGHKLYDYLSYGEYRFKFRTSKWIGISRKMDRSVSPENRSIHNFCFSKQFYFSIAIATWGILLFMNGMYILYAQQYKPFADSLLMILLIVIWLAFTVLDWILSKLSAYINVWRLPKRPNQEACKRIEDEKKKLESYFDVEKMMRTNFFRLFFVRENKEWIINNLKNFISAENFHDNEGYLLRIYQKLVDEEIRENNEKKRKDFINQKKYEHLSQLTLKDLDYAAEKNLARADGRPHFPGEDNKVPRVKKSVVQPLTYLLYHWFSFAKQNIYLKNLVEDIENSKIAGSCHKCGQEYALKLIPQKPLVELLAQFRIQYAGLPFNKYEWRKFYEKRQQFKTLCDDCKFIDLMKKKKMMRSRLSSRLITGESQPKGGLEQTDTDEQSVDPYSETQLDKEREEKKVDVPAPLRKILLPWYWSMKANVLHQKGGFQEEGAMPTTLADGTVIPKTEEKREEKNNVGTFSDVNNNDEDSDQSFEEKNPTNVSYWNPKNKKKGLQSARGIQSARGLQSARE